VSPVVLISTKDNDPSVLAAAVRGVVDRLVGDEDRTLAVEEMAGEDLTVGDVVDACQTPPFLSGLRVIVVREVDRWSTEDVEPLVAYLADPLASTALVLVGGGGKRSQRLVNAVKRMGDVIDATVPSGRARTGWLVEQLHAGPVVLDGPAGSRLDDHLGEDVGRLPGLLEALAVRYGEGARIGVAELEPYLGEAGGVAPWDLTDALDKSDTAGALGALARMMGAGERHPLAVLATLHRHYGAALRLEGSGVRSDKEAAGLVGMADFPAGKARKVAARLGAEGIGRAITLLAEADLDLRGVKDWPEGLVMEVLVARLSRLGGHRGAPAAHR
jgi:DNA polymerase III subunit delta